MALVSAGPRGERVEERVWNLDGRGPEERASCLLSIGLSYGVTVERVLFGRLGLFDESLPVAQDTEFLLRFLEAGLAFDAVSSVRVRHHLHTGGCLTGRSWDGARLAAIGTLLERYSDYLETAPALKKMLESGSTKIRHRLGSGGAS